MNPYSTPAEFTYTPMPFQELMAAGQLADKRIYAQLEQASKHAPIEFSPTMPGDAEKAKQIYSAETERINKLVGDIYANPGKAAEHSKELISLASTTKDPWSERNALADRKAKEVKLQTDVDKTAWNSPAKDLLKKSITAKDFSTSYDPVTGVADAPVYGYKYGLPTYMTTQEVQARINTALANSMDTTLENQGIDKATRNQLIAQAPNGQTAVKNVYEYYKKTGKDLNTINKALAGVVTPDLIGWAQLTQDSENVSTGKPATDESDVYTTDANGTVVFNQKTILGRMLNSAAILKAHVEIQDKKEEVSTSGNAADAAAAKAKALEGWNPGGQVNSDMSSKIYPLYPKNVIEMLEGDGKKDGKKGLNKEIEELKIAINSNKYAKGDVGAEKAALDHYNLQKLTNTKKNIEQIYDSYAQQTTAYKALEEFASTKEDQLRAGLPEDFKPSAIALDLIKIVEANEFIVDTDFDMEEFQEKTGGTPWNDLKAATRQYVENAIAFKEKTLNYQKDIRKELEDEETIAKIVKLTGADELGGVAAVVETLPEIAGQQDTPGDPSHAIAHKILQTPRGYRMITSKGNIIDEKYMKGTAGAFQEGGSTNKKDAAFTFDVVGVTGGHDLQQSELATKAGNPYIVANFKNKAGRIVETVYIEPINASQMDIYNTIRDIYAKSKGLKGGEHDYSQAEMMYYIKDSQETSEDIGGYRLRIGEHPIVPKVMKTTSKGVGDTVVDYKEYYVNMGLSSTSTSEVIRGTMLPDKTILRFGENYYNVPKIPVLVIKHGSDNTVKTIAPNGEQMVHGEGVSGWRKADEYISREKHFYKSATNIAAAYYNTISAS